jgi:glycosyltransferase involved in cell wall biosynthesis
MAREFPLAAIRRLTQLVRDGRYDLLVTHDHKANAMGYFAARAARAQCLALVHGYDLSLWRMRLYRRTDIRLLRRFPHVVVVADAVRRELIGAGVDPSRVSVVHNAIDVSRFSDGASQRAAPWRGRHAEMDGPVVLAVARLYRVKGLEYLLRAVPGVRAVHPGARFWIVGAGPLERMLRLQAQRLALGDAVRFLGEQDDVAAIMAASDVVVLPSLSEGLSYVILEAMAVARPLVVTDVGGNSEVVRAGETGWLVAPRDAPCASSRRRSGAATSARGPSSSMASLSAWSSRSMK